MIIEKHLGLCFPFIVGSKLPQDRSFTSKKIKSESAKLKLILEIPVSRQATANHWASAMTNDPAKIQICMSKCRKTSQPNSNQHFLDLCHNAKMLMLSNRDIIRGRIMLSGRLIDWYPARALATGTKATVKIIRRILMFRGSFLIAQQQHGMFWGCCWKWFNFGAENCIFVRQHGWVNVKFYLYIKILRRIVGLPNCWPSDFIGAFEFTRTCWRIGHWTLGTL